jgi:hypothetical protein
MLTRRKRVLHVVLLSAVEVPVNVNVPFARLPTVDPAPTRNW